MVPKKPDPLEKAPVQDAGGLKTGYLTPGLGSVVLVADHLYAEGLRDHLHRRDLLPSLGSEGQSVVAERRLDLHLSGCHTGSQRHHHRWLVIQRRGA